MKMKSAASRAAPEHELLDAQLWKKSLTRARSSRRARGRPLRASAGAPRGARAPRRGERVATVSSCSTRVGSLVRSERPPRRLGDSGSRPRASALVSSRGVPMRDDAAFAQDGDAVGELLGLVEVVRGQQYRLAERAQRADHLPGRASRRRVEAGRRLVEEEEVGVADERDAEVEAPLLAAGQRLHTGVFFSPSPTSSITSSMSRGRA